MAITHLDITENDCVELRTRVGPWPAGTQGTVLGERGPSKLVEISDDRGQELDMIGVSEAQLRLIKAYPG
jgi:hypothetical protein